jgi:DNA-binding protein YbaB
VKVVVTGSGEVRAVSIAADVVDPDDIEMLEDLVVAAVNEGLRAAQDLQAQKMGAVTGGMDLGSLGGLLG